MKEIENRKRKKEQKKKKYKRAWGTPSAQQMKQPTRAFLQNGTHLPLTSLTCGPWLSGHITIFNLQPVIMQGHPTPRNFLSTKSQ
jgi:hypothetical protein